MQVFKINDVLAESALSEMTQHQRKALVEASLEFIEAFKPKSSFSLKHASKAALKAVAGLGLSAGSALLGFLAFLVHPVIGVSMLPEVAVGTIVFPLILGVDAVSEVSKAFKNLKYSKNALDVILDAKDKLIEVLKDAHIDEKAFFDSLLHNVYAEKLENKKVDADELKIHNESELLLVAASLSKHKDDLTESEVFDVQKYLKLYEFAKVAPHKPTLRLALRNFDELSKFNIAETLESIYSESLTSQKQEFIERLKFLYEFQQSSFKVDKKDITQDGNNANNTVFHTDTTSETYKKLKLFHRAIDSKEIRDVILEVIRSKPTDIAVALDQLFEQTQDGANLSSAVQKESKKKKMLS